MYISFKSISIRVSVLVILFVALLIVHAVELSTVQIELLNALNNLRQEENYVPLSANEALNSVAERLLDDVSMRDLANLGDILRLSDGTSLDQLLNEVDYLSYDDGYEVDVITLILRHVPAQAVPFWNQGYETNEGMHSQQMRDETLIHLPIFYDRFREVGIAYRYNEVTEKHYYVFVFASQPDIFPITITYRLSNDAITSTMVLDVVVHVPNEVIRRTIANAILQDKIEFVRISEIPSTQDCPSTAGESEVWERWRKSYDYILSENFGLKTLYVQLCDADGNTITETASIFYGDEASPTDIVEPQVLGAVYATQTAAVEATSYTHTLPTIEFILTATATAP